MSAKSDNTTSNKEDLDSDWPDDWPIQATDPINDLEDDVDPGASALTPGGSLKTLGTADVLWSRGAAEGQKSVIKKYLFLLPGLLSVNHPQHEKSFTSPLANKSAQSGHEELDIANKSNEVEHSTLDTTPVSSQQQPTILGRFRRSFVDSSSSSSSVATLDLSGGLRLDGRQVKTTSKFVVLTAIQTKKRTVTCKHVFDSVIVFGNASSTSASHEANEELIKSTFEHYGASNRTVNGGNSNNSVIGSGTKQRSKAMKLNTIPTTDSLHTISSPYSNKINLSSSMDLLPNEGNGIRNNAGAIEEKSDLRKGQPPFSDTMTRSPFRHDDGDGDDMNAKEETVVVLGDASSALQFPSTPFSSRLSLKSKRQPIFLCEPEPDEDSSISELSQPHTVSTPNTRKIKGSIHFKTTASSPISNSNEKLMNSGPRARPISPARTRIGSKLNISSASLNHANERNRLKDPILSNDTCLSPPTRLRPSKRIRSTDVDEVYDLTTEDELHSPSFLSSINLRNTVPNAQSIRH